MKANVYKKTVGVKLEMAITAGVIRSSYLEVSLATHAEW